MAFTLEQLKDAVADLPKPDRAELAQFLVRSLDDAEAAQVRAEWFALAERRMADVRAGKVVGIPAEDVLNGLLRPAQ
jgi:putative addiction module component (TIGR02574 family)